MSETVPEYVHEFPSLEVYPRVHYFHRRFRDLLARYKRVIGALPKCFTNEGLCLELEQLNDTLEYGINVHVIGNEDLEETDIVFCSLPLQRKSQAKVTAASISVLICHVSLENLDKKDVFPVINVLGSKIRTPDLEHIVFVKIDVNQPYTEDESVVFRRDVLEKLKGDQKEYDVAPNNILINSDGRDLKEMISDTLESKLVSGLFKICSHLQLLESVECDPVSDDVLHNDAVVTSIKAFLQTAHNRIDMPLTDDTDEASSNRVLELVLQSVCRVIKCSCVNLLAKKFGLQTWICNQLLHEIKFEEALADSVSKNTRYHMRKLAEVTVDVRKNKKKETKKFNRFNFLLYRLQEDMKPVVKEVEKKLDAMKRLTLVMKKMAFETHGYLKQTHVNTAFHISLQVDEISKELREELLGIPGVYGLGTLYGQLEVHLDPDLVEDATATAGITDGISTSHSRDKEETGMHRGENVNFESSTTSYKPGSFPSLKLTIASKIRKYRFYSPYTVTFITKKPVNMAVSFEPGDKLLRREKKTGGDLYGTVGGFVITTDGKLYGLTCGHVVGQTQCTFVDKGGWEPFSNCSKTVQSGDEKLKLIDIAALEVLPSLQKSCKESLERNFERVSKTKLAVEKPEQLIGNGVYKFGAATGKTEGVIISVDYGILGTNAEEYLLIIDSLSDKPDDFTEDFSPLNIKKKQIPSKRMENDSSEITEGIDQTGQNKAKTIESSTYARVRDEAYSDPFENMRPNEDGIRACPKATSNRNRDEHNVFLTRNKKSEIGKTCSPPVSVKQKVLNVNNQNTMVIDGTVSSSSPFHKGESRTINEELICSENERPKKDIGLLCTNSVPDGSSDKNSMCLSQEEKSETEEKGWLHVSCIEDECKDSSSDIKLMRQENVDGKQKRLGDKAVWSNPLVYVRDNACFTESSSADPNAVEMPFKVFAQEGDSGSIICTLDPSYNGLSSLAVSMLSAGNFQIKGHEGMKCISFKLNEGLQRLKESYQLEFAGSF